MGYKKYKYKKKITFKHFFKLTLRCILLALLLYNILAYLLLLNAKLNSPFQSDMGSSVWSTADGSITISISQQGKDVVSVRDGKEIIEEEIYTLKMLVYIGNFGNPYCEAYVPIYLSENRFLLIGSGSSKLFGNRVFIMLTRLNCKYT